MKNVYLMIVITAVLGVAFGFALNWAMGIDYSPLGQSMAPIAVAGLLGVLALSALGGVLGAVLDHWDETA